MLTVQGIIGIACLFCVVSCRNFAEPPFYIKPSSLVCVGNPELLVNITCRLKAVDWRKSVAIMDSDLVGEIKNASLHMAAFKYTNQFRPFFMNLSINLCHMLDTSKGNAYVRIFMKLLKRYSNINHGCPYTGHLAAHDVYVDPQMIPFAIPSGKYKAIFTFYEGWPFVHIGTVEAVGTITEETSNRRPRRITDLQRSSG